MEFIDVTSPREGVAIVSFNRPDRLNALTERLVDELHEALAALDRDTDCRVVVLTGRGRAFCAGLDLDGYTERGSAGFDDSVITHLERQRHIATVAERLHALRVPVIAAINGAAAGGGLAFACASDIRICVPEAVFAVSFIRAGYSACDIGTSWLLPRIVGAGRAHELMLTGRRFGADEAERIGLVTQVVAAEELLPAALEKASEIMLNPPFSVELTKSGMWTALETPAFHASVEFENRQQILTAMTADCAEARAAFLGKRAPHYRYA